jgi:pimeloyl-ACP methyl ester carboxylesterase
VTSNRNGFESHIGERDYRLLFGPMAERLMSERSPTGFDPVPDLETLNAPGLWLQGDHDWRVPAIKSVRILDRLIKESNRPYAYHIFPGAGHTIFLPRKKGERLIPELAPGYWQVMDDWLAHQTTVHDQNTSTALQPF